MTTYGTLSLTDGTWRITDLQPHVAIALKRFLEQQDGAGE